MDIKGKVNYFTREELKQLAPELQIDDFSDISVWYDILEETLLHKGFTLSDPEEEIKFMHKWQHGQSHWFKYNCAVVRTTLVKEKHKIQEIGIQYFGIKNTRTMNDLEKLTMVFNNLKPFDDGNGKPQDDGVKAQKLLQEHIDKMKRLGLKNLK